MSGRPHALSALALLLIASGADAASTASCQLFHNQQWSEQGTRTLEDCLRLVDRQPAERGSQDADLKFGAWGDVMIAADRSNYYRSDNGGGDWSPIGGKSAGSSAAAAAPAAASPAPGGPRTGVQPPRAAPAAAAAPAAVAAAPAASAYLPEPAYAPPSPPVTPITSTTSPYYPAGYNSATASSSAPVTPAAVNPIYAPAAAPVAEQQVFVATLTGEPYKVLQVDKSLDQFRCELLVGQAWRSERKTSSLDQCATEMENRGARDRNGQLRAYWGTVTLTADNGVIYASRNGTDWIKLRKWGEPLPQPVPEPVIKTVTAAPAKPPAASPSPSLYSRMKGWVGLGKKNPPPSP